MSKGGIWERKNKRKKGRKPEGKNEEEEEEVGMKK